MKTTHKILPVGCALLALLPASLPCFGNPSERSSNTSSPEQFQSATRHQTSEETEMNNKESYTTSFTVEQSPEETFRAINNPRGWWSQAVEGDTNRLGAEFAYHFKDLHRCRLKVVELVPNQKVVWEVLENHFTFTKDRTEWTGTKICFEISQTDGKTQVQFTHIGLVPDYECFKACSDGWRTYINGSLRKLITTGEGQPNVGDAITGSEQTLGGQRG